MEKISGCAEVKKDMVRVATVRGITYMQIALSYRRQHLYKLRPLE